MIVVFGSLNVDLVMQVARLPRPGETVINGTYFLVPGGKGANQALAAARAAEDATLVAMAGCVGPDDWGGLAIRLLAEAGIDLTALKRGTLPTGCATVCVDAAGENAIAVASGANREAAADQVDDRWLGTDTWLVLQMEVPAAENWRLIGRAKRRGARIVLNLAPAAAVPPDVLNDLDVLVVNEIEARMLIDAPAEAAARDLARRHGLTCIVTLGSAGAVAAGPKGVWQVGTLPVDVVDTTGAGDAFVGVLVAALAAGRPLPEALRRAAVGAALSCTVAGTQSSFAPAVAIANRLADLPPPIPLD
ncbi:MAG TPA: ribokinase [Kiloniellales bacterium]